MRKLAILLLPLLIACRGSVTTTESSSRPTAKGEWTRARTPAQVMSSHGWEWLERPERETEELPERVIDTMRLEPDDHVAEIGAGTGYFARRIARRLGPDGKIYANDIQPEMLAKMVELAAQQRISNLTPILGSESDPLLPDGSIDWMLLVDVYHEFQHPEAMLQAMRNDLKTGGRVALVEYRLEGETARHIRTEHRMSPAQVLEEWEGGGFRLIRREEFLPSQHLFIFERRD
jgi:predicted methyltransferase